MIGRVQTMSPAAARRTALAAQGFADPRPTSTPTRRHLQRVLDRTQLIQLDSVNVAVRAHYAPLFSRLGAYPTELLDEAAWSHSARRPRLLVEYWGHEASVLPVADWPLFRWRMNHYESLRGRHWKAAVDTPELVADVLAAVKELGPVGAGALEKELGGQGRGPGAWWERSEVKMVCEYLFAVGGLTTGTRRSFERLYDLPERVIPPEVLGRPELPVDVAHRELIRRSAVALGVATETDLRDYYRLPVAGARQAVAELVEEGELEPVEVLGWGRQAYRHVRARTPRKVAARALLCPFDPLIWERARTERMFGFHYRIEIYVPAPKRVHGYYVFPFLLDEQLAARVDLKADRAAGLLRVPGAFLEEGPGQHPRARVVAELAEELTLMAQWLGLSGVAVGGRGDLAVDLAAALR
ncbi:winged helix DNA-binding domain-containing protein [Crossiella sp. SN42]|uniref:winged helix-turn-helix domain-containing protein n=1 Tax=Crossiella sp. SN42 TaxID=2944808 RepID=UPI00207C197F|nr:crosslink repair DNA glycosylase YcaQ family protein [Crossiella sp. SN42]MCO1576641.1 winged helix DNA-binding domain-containing protein [Crossiella sp. SN42]